MQCLHVMFVKTFRLTIAVPCLFVSSDRSLSTSLHERVQPSQYLPLPTRYCHGHPRILFNMASGYGLAGGKLHIHASPPKLLETAYRWDWTRRKQC